MRVVSLNKEGYNCIFGTCIMAFITFLLVVTLKMAIAGLTKECGTDKFVESLCKAVETERMEGGACGWLCENKEGSSNKNSLSLCSSNSLHDMESSLFMKSSMGPVFAMDKGYVVNISSGYSLHTTVRPDGDTFMRESYRIKDTFRAVLNGYLNQGAHSALLNSIKHPTKEPVPAAYLQSTIEILQNKRFMLSLLFFGTGDRSMEAPGTATESIPAVSLDYTCGGIYQTFSLVNNTTPLSSVLNKSSSSWSMGPSINVYHLYEVIIHLLDLEETTSEHEYEGTFFLCNLNTSQILLHKDCVKGSQSESFMLSHPCTLKVLDISNALYSQYEVESRLSPMSCSSNADCMFHSCQGACIGGRCTVSSHTSMSGVLQICQLLKSIEGQILEETTDEPVRGEFHFILDRCLDLKFYPQTVIDPSNHYSLYNTLFQDLKHYFFKLHDRKTFKLKNHVEMLAARKEASKQAAEKQKKSGHS